MSTEIILLCKDKSLIRVYCRPFIVEELEEPNRDLILDYLNQDFRVVSLIVETNANKQVQSDVYICSLNDIGDIYFHFNE